MIGLIKNAINRCNDYLEHLLAHTVIITATILALKFVINLIDYLFTENKPIYGGITSYDLTSAMEVASHIGLLLIFLIYVVRDVYLFYGETWRDHDGIS